MLTPNQFMAALLDSNPINLYPFLGLLSDGTMMMTAYNRTYLYTYISPYGLINSTAAPVPDLPHPVSPVSPDWLDLALRCVAPLLWLLKACSITQHEEQLLACLSPINGTHPGLQPDFPTGSSLTLHTPYACLHVHLNHSHTLTSLSSFPPLQDLGSHMLGGGGGGRNFASACAIWFAAWHGMHVLH